MGVVRQGAAMPGGLGSAAPAGDERLERRAFLRATAGTLVLNISTLAVSFALSLVLARTLGAGGYGAYAYAFAWATFLAVPATLGLTPLVIRHVSQYEVREDWSLMRGVLRRVHQFVGVTGVALAAAAAGLGWALRDHDSELTKPFLLGLLLVPLISLTGIRQAAMQGLNRVILGRLPETIVSPVLFLLLVIVVSQVRDGGLTAEWAVALNVAAAFAAFVLGTALLRSALPRQTREAKPEYHNRAWLESGLPLLALGLVMVINGQVGTILLGATDGAESAGIFNVAVRFATFSSFLFLTVSYPLYSVVARLWAAGATDQLQRLLTRTGRAVLVFTAAVAVPFLLFPQQLLALFGPDFDAGVGALRILVVGEVLKVACGFGGLALVMSPYERSMAVGMALGVAVNVPLTAALIPIWGIEGAAIGSTAGAAISSILVAWLAWRRLGVYAPGLGRVRGASVDPVSTDA